MEALIAGGTEVLTSPLCWIMIVLGVIIGIVFGAVPGLTATTAIAMFLPVTYAMSITPSIALLVSLYIGGISGGLISAILLNMPGTPSSIATCFDGRPLALKGQAGKALGVGVVFSFWGTLFGIAVLVVIAGPLASLTIKFGPWEYFAVTFFSLSLIAGLSGKDIIRGLMSAVVGMMFVSVGMAPIDGVMRFTFGHDALIGGFQQMTVLVGMYAISEVMETASLLQLDKDAKVEGPVKIKGVGFSWEEFCSQIKNLVRSALIGVGIGILPGIGGSTSNILSYSAAKNTSKYPEKFGTGIIDGVVASETANNATIGGAMIPLLTLGIPGDGVTALLLGGFVMNGVQPGPLIFANHANVVYGVYMAMLLASFVMLISMLGGMRFFINVLKIPKNYLLPMIMVLCVVGAFALNNRVFDVAALIFFGVVGYLLQKYDFPLPPLILGFVLGGTFETSLRRGLQISGGNISGLLNSPIALSFVLIGIAGIVFTMVRQRRRGSN